MIALMNWRVWAALAIAVALAASHWKAYRVGQAQIKADWAAERLEQANQSRKLLEKTAADTAELQTVADQTKEVKDAQIQALNTRVAALDTELRKRPQRPGGASMPEAPSDGKAASGCTGAGLYGQDAEFLVGEAAAAAKLRIHLKACYQQYDAARTKFEALTKKD